MESGEIVRAVNNGTTAVTLRWGSRNYPIPTTRETVIPFDAMVSYFGDPRAKENIRSVKDSFGIMSWIPDRPSEVRRLRIKWGVEGGSAKLVNSGMPKLPDITFTDLDGNPIITVVEDPLGEHVEQAIQTVSEVELLREQLIRQGAQIDQLLAAQRPSPVDEEIEASGLESDGPGEPVLSTPTEAARPVESFVEQAAQAFSSSPAAPSSASLADVPEDDATATYTGSESSRAGAVTDTTGHNVRLSSKAEELAALRDDS